LDYWRVLQGLGDLDVVWIAVKRPEKLEVGHDGAERQRTPFRGDIKARYYMVRENIFTTRRHNEARDMGI
jgi:hypothetical protein